MAYARSLTAASLTLALMGAYGLASHSSRVQAQTRPALQASLVVNGERRSITTDAPRVGDILSQSGIAVGPQDQVHPPLNTPAFAGITINLNTPQTREELIRTPVPFHTVVKRTVRLLPGRRQEAQHGAEGVQVSTYRITAVGSQVIDRTLVSKQVTKHPVDQIVLVGTDPFTTSRGLDGSTRSFTMIATMYDVYLGGAGTGRTATGIRARRGVVAVDPRFIRLGTRLYVEGYGYCVAADTGGAIKGRRIDLCVPSTAEADRYGRRQVRVYIVP